MSDLVKKKKHKFKKSTPKKVEEKKETPQKKKLSFLKRFSFTLRKRDFVVLALLILPLNFILFAVIVSELIQLQKFQTDSSDMVLSAQSFTYPDLIASKSALFVTTPSYIVYDKSSRVVVDGKNTELRFAPASSAKIMTALCALEFYNLDTELIVPSLESVSGSTMGLEEGEKISVRNLLYGLMLPSGNDAAYVLAYYYPSGYTGFVEAMNVKAEALKLFNTHFVDPAGFDDANFTTAFDMARLGAYALDNKTLATIVSTKEMTVSDVSGKIEHRLKNLNELLGIDGVNGIKTGFTEEAGGVLVTSVMHNNRTFITVLFKSSDRFGDTRQLLKTIIASIRTIQY